MRNYFAIAFTCVYLTLTVGVAKTTHYCMGQEKHSSLFSFTTQKCYCAAFMAAKSSCCDDRQEIIKIQDDHSGSPVLITSNPEFNFLGEVYTISPEVTPKMAVHQTLDVDDNPPPPKLPHYQLFCSLVFYDRTV